MFGKSPDMTGTTPFVWKSVYFSCHGSENAQDAGLMLGMRPIFSHYFSLRTLCQGRLSASSVLGEFSSFFAQRKFDILEFCGLPTDSPVRFFENNMRQELGQTVAQSCCFDALCLD